MTLPLTSKNKSHCFFLSAGKLRAIFGDQTDHGAGKDMHSGIWYLVNIDTRVNLVAPGNSILLLGAHRGTCPEISCLDNGTIELFKPGTDDNNHLATRGTYALTEPHYVDYTLEVTAEKDFTPSADSAQIWCCYMNTPRQGGIHFLENGLWRYYFNPVHGQGAMLWPTSLPRERREPWANPAIENVFDGTRWFYESDSGHTFDYPFYFGEIHDLMFLIMLDRYEDVRFFISPTGGGPGYINRERTCPAWDIYWRLPAMQAGEKKQIHIRLAVKLPTIANHYFADDAWAEYEIFRKEYPSVTGPDRAPTSGL